MTSREGRARLPFGNAAYGQIAQALGVSVSMIEKHVSAALAHLPAGELRGAIGSSHRKNDFEFQPDTIRESHPIIDIPISTFSNARVAGSMQVTEAYAELLVPLLRDLPMVDSLTLELGGRYSHYHTLVACRRTKRCSRGRQSIGCASAAAISSPIARPTSTSCSSARAACR